MPGSEVLTPFQKKVLSLFSAIPESRAFYLTGGTALAAFYLHHRLSEDFDLFTPDEPLIGIVSQKFAVALRASDVHVEEVRNFRAFWEAVLSKGGDGIKVQLAYDSPFMLADTEEREGVRIHSLPDIAAGKLLALYGRAEERDFIDIYFIVQEGPLSFEEILELAAKKDPGVDEYYLAIALEQAADLPDHPSRLRLRLLKPVDLQKLKAFFSTKAVDLIEKRKGR